MVQTLHLSCLFLGLKDLGCCATCCLTNRKTLLKYTVPRRNISRIQVRTNLSRFLVGVRKPLTGANFPEPLGFRYFEKEWGVLLCFVVGLGASLTIYGPGWPPTYDSTASFSQMLAPWVCQSVQSCMWHQCVQYHRCAPMCLESQECTSVPHHHSILVITIFSLAYKQSSPILLMLGIFG